MSASWISLKINFISAPLWLTEKKQKTKKLMYLQPPKIFKMTENYKTKAI